MPPNAPKCSSKVQALQTRLSSGEGVQVSWGVQLVVVYLQMIFIVLDDELFPYLEISCGYAQLVFWPFGPAQLTS